jgi:hypothetical protein
MRKGVAKMDVRYKVGEEVEVSFMGRIEEVKIKKDTDINGEDVERVVYLVEGLKGTRGYNIEADNIFPLAQESEVESESR